jgi:hypothetical protein
MRCCRLGQRKPAHPSRSHATALGWKRVGEEADGRLGLGPYRPICSQKDCLGHTVRRQMRCHRTLPRHCHVYGVREPRSAPAVRTASLLAPNSTQVTRGAPGTPIRALTTLISAVSDRIREAPS